MFEKFLSTIGIGSMKVDTVVDQSKIAHGETLSGTIYIDGGQSNQVIESIKLEVLKRTEGHREDSDFDVTDVCIGKLLIDTVGSMKSKDTRMVPFELIPDDRWSSEESNVKLYLRTTVQILNAVDVQDEDEIVYIKDLD
ncbi:sporulation protein [Paenisporosarcina sp. TG20]|uniref:sporulation protein n=1 Tax=Paenisporosarcina sp. TG20 TaxID=1211706 RepID=UPI0002D8E531|nr:sporulation protein [Paenisporosarcina sp. TG20]